MIAVGSVVLAWLLREALTPIWGPNSLPFLFFFPAIVLTAWYGRLRLALLSIGLSAVLANYFFLEPRHTFGISNAGEAVGIIAFVICSIAVAYGIEAMHRANERAKRAVEAGQLASHASAHLAAIVTSSSDAIVSKTLEGIVRSWNYGAERVFGYTADEMIGQPIRRLIPADIQPEEDFILARIRAGERLEHYETVRLRKDGKPLNVSLTISPIKNSAGEIIGASKIARDITERKILDDALRESVRQQEALYTFVDRLHRAENLNEVYDAANDAILTAVGCDRAAILIFDDAGVMRFVASRGLSEEYQRAVEGHSPWTPDTKDPQPVSISDIRTAKMDESLRTAIQKEGIGSLQFFPLIVDAHLIGKFMTYYDAPHDSTKEQIDLATSIARQLSFAVARRRTQEALRENEERLRLATETGKVGIWDWDIATDRISWTDSLYEMHGVNRDEIIGLDSFASLIHAEDRIGVSQALNESLKSNVPYELEFRVVKPDGEIGWVFTNAVVFRDGGQPTRVVGVTLDITDRKRAEEERDAVLAREQELRRAAEQANRLKDEFLATMSHELRNPLNVILGYSEVLLRTDEFRNSPQLTQMGEAVRRNALAQSHLIRDLLDLSRLRSGKLALTTETVSVMTAINNAVETVRAEAAAKQIDIQIETPDGALFVEGDLLRVEQIIWNLLTNAVKFTPARGRIVVRANREGDYVGLSVTDTGQGIDSAFLPHVFEMFRQADASTSRAQSGMGIGLALVRQLVELHGGTVEVKSGGVGRGTCFVVRFRQSEQPRALPAGVVELSSEPIGQLDVLVLDDSEDTTEMLRHLLEQSGAVVVTASNGLDALRIASEHEFDIVLSDISMPGMDGFEFVRRLRELPGKRDVPVLALTGFGRPEDISRAENEGFFSHLTKPFDLGALAQILEKIPSRRSNGTRST